jgi:hypothetical protein
VALQTVNLLFRSKLSQDFKSNNLSYDEFLNSVSEE